MYCLIFSFILLGSYYLLFVTEFSSISVLEILWGIGHITLCSHYCIFFIFHFCMLCKSTIFAFSTNVIWVSKSTAERCVYFIGCSLNGIFVIWCYAGLEFYFLVFLILLHCVHQFGAVIVSTVSLFCSGYCCSWKVCFSSKYDSAIIALCSSSLCICLIK